MDVPTTVDEKVALPGSEACTIVPVPVRAAGVMEVDALVVTASEPERKPGTVGLNTTAMEQLAPAARDAPQLFVWLKSPVAVTLVMAKARVLVLASEKISAVDELPSAVAGKVVVPVSEPVVATPLPLSETGVVTARLFDVR